MTFVRHIPLKAIAVVIITALAFSNYAQAHDSTHVRSKWLDEYPKHVGLTYSGEMSINANYIWRGLYVGGLNLQAEASVGYGGLFYTLWGNIGTSNWAFSSLMPEVDNTIGFSRWGLTVLFIHMYYFDQNEDGTRSQFFDFGNHEKGGITTEWRIKYKVSSKLPLSILLCTRTWGRDGYRDEHGELQRAYSTYCELGYDFKLPYSLTLETRLGFTPWKSFYTSYKGDFAVTNISAQLVYRYAITDYCTLHANAMLMFNPWHVTKDNMQWNSTNPSEQRLNMNIALGVTF